MAAHAVRLIITVQALTVAAPLACILVHDVTTTALGGECMTQADCLADKDLVNAEVSARGQEYLTECTVGVFVCARVSSCVCVRSA